MPNSRTGHFVQIWKALGHPYIDVDYVDVDYSRWKIARTVSSYPIYAQDGWFGMSRELSRRDAIKYARAYRRAGFPSRVIFRGNSGERKITDEFLPKKAKHRG